MVRGVQGGVGGGGNGGEGGGENGLFGVSWCFMVEKRKKKMIWRWCCCWKWRRRWRGEWWRIW